MKREQARKRKQKRNLMLGAGGIVAVIAAAVAFFLFAGSGPEIGRAVATQPGTHYSPENFPNYQYNTSPPSSGPHYPFTAPYGFHGQDLDPHAVVHNMEHGAVVIWYQPDPSLAGQVNQLVRELGNQCIVAGSYTDMEATVAATAWGRILELDGFDREQLVAFVQAYRGKLGPEAGLCRSES